MRARFPYLQQNSQWYPVVDITLRGPRAEITAKALVDSGASFSVFRAEIAEYLGLTLEGGKPLYLEGIGGRILGYAHRIPIEVIGKRFICPIVFSRKFSVSLNLVGRDTFFSKFRITFNERRKELVLGYSAEAL